MFEGAIIVSVEGSFVTDEEIETWAVAGEVAEDPGGAEIGGEVLVGSRDAVFLVDQIEVEETGFELENAVQPPSGRGHGFDGMELGWGLGLEFGEVGVEEVLEFGWRFVGEDDGFRAEAVAECVIASHGRRIGVN